MNVQRLTFGLWLAGLLGAVLPVSAAPASQATPASTAALTGVVRDASGGAIQGALVIARLQSRGEQQTVTGTAGQFSFDLPAQADVELIVRAGGFAEYQRRVSTATRDLAIVLQPSTLLETVVVTATRSEQRLGDVPASVNVLTREEIQASPAVLADDVLRQLPTFSLFRRTSAIAAQPTTQGVSLRGIGPSGQSRTLVLLDGIPFNDPFGGWVYWTRVPLLSVDRIEVTNDTTSSLYGNYAMGGVINIVTSRPTRRTVEIKPQFGNLKTPKVDFFASDQWNKVGAAVEGSFFSTDGFPIVEAIERGPIDNNARVDYKNVSAKFDYTPSDRVGAFFRVGYFTENRVNAKVGEVNDTRWTAVNGGVRARLPGSSDLQARVFVDVERAHFNFLAVLPNAVARQTVRLATDQKVPTDAVGGTAQWAKAFGGRNLLSVGADWRWVDGDSVEDAYVAAVPAVVDGVTQRATLSVQRISGGTQQSSGFFVQDIFTPAARLVVTLSARVDHWRNYDGHNLETTVATGLPTANNKVSCTESGGVPPACLADRTDTVVSPRVAALYHVSDRVTVWGAANSGFRAPTLTELYRQFTVGAALTRPNDQLGPERLVGGEAGINVAAASNVTVRATWFENRITDAVANVTIGMNLLQKLPIRTRVRGLQSDVEYRLGSSWRVSGGYFYDQATVVDGGVNPALTGLFLQQVPKHRGSVQIAYANPKVINAAFGVQFVGAQFNDDLNVNFIPVPTLTDAGYDSATPPGLPGYSVVDLLVSRDLGRNVQVFVGAQNLLDKLYFVQTNPSTIGTPRLVNGGVRIRFSGR